MSCSQSNLCADVGVAFKVLGRKRLSADGAGALVVVVASGDDADAERKLILVLFGHFDALPTELVRVARFFLVQHTKTGKYIPSDHKMYESAIRYT
jgi:hypothetical protein